MYKYIPLAVRNRKNEAKLDALKEYTLSSTKPLLAVDTETTGLDIRHGCMPFMVQTCNEQGETTIWEWEVNPYTREPYIPLSDIKEIKKTLQGKSLVWHNKKFDTLVLSAIGIDVDQLVDIKDQHDTLIAHHVLSSSGPHGLKNLGERYLDINTDDEETLHQVVDQCRRYGRKNKWRIAKAHDPHFPSAKKSKKGGFWQADMWLPAAYAKKNKLPKSAIEWTVAKTYGGRDVERTLALWVLLREGLTSEDSWYQYLIRRNLIPVVHSMEQKGIGISPKRYQECVDRFLKVSTDNKNIAFKIAKKVDPDFDNLNSPKQLNKLLYEKWNVEIVKTTKETATGGGNPSTDQETIDELLSLHLKPTSQEHQFLTSLVAHRKASKACKYLASYQLASHPKRLVVNRNGFKKFYKWWRIHPNFNITGTATTRFSSSDPNAQNIGKKEHCNLRVVFGPELGRCWFSYDYNNIEMRIFAYESNSKDLIEAFERGESVHMVIAKILWPKEVARLGEQKFKETELYSWTKNGNFSLIYGAGVRKADATYHQKGAYAKIRKGLKEVDRFMRAKNREVVKKGYVTLLGGYKLEVPENGPHKAVNFFCQGSAAWFIEEAMLRCYTELEKIPDHHMVLQVHDELVFDCPKKFDPTMPLRIKNLMEQSGKNYNIPTPVECKIIHESWATGTQFALAT